MSLVRTAAPNTGANTYLVGLFYIIFRDVAGAVSRTTVSSLARHFNYSLSGAGEKV